MSRTLIEIGLFRNAIDLRRTPIDSAVSCLRRIIDRAGPPSRISTVRGKGYRLEP